MILVILQNGTLIFKYFINDVKYTYKLRYQVDASIHTSLRVAFELAHFLYTLGNIHKGKVLVHDCTLQDTDSGTRHPFSIHPFLQSVYRYRHFFLLHQFQVPLGPFPILK